MQESGLLFSVRAEHTPDLREGGRHGDSQHPQHVQHDQRVPSTVGIGSCGYGSWMLRSPKICTEQAGGPRELMV